MTLFRPKFRPAAIRAEPEASAKTARIRAQIRKRRETMVRNKDLSTGTLVGGAAVSRGASRTRAEEQHQDRIVLMVRDSYWLQASWEITRASVERAGPCVVCALVRVRCGAVIRCGGWSLVLGVAWDNSKWARASERLSYRIAYRRMCVRKKYIW